MSRTPKAVLLTGGSGFIGSHVLDYFVHALPNTMFVNVDILDRCANPKNTQDLDRYRNYRFIHADILEKFHMIHLLREYNIDTIMHFATQTHVDNSFGNSMTFTQTNVLGTHTLLEAAREVGVQLFIHVSTDEVYGTSDPDDEDKTEQTAILDPTNPYSATKAAAEMLVRSYHHSYGIPCIITRGNNVYGPKQFPEKVIPKFIKRIARGLPCEIHGSGSQQRSFIHARDVATAFEAILLKGEVGKIYNIGSENEMSIEHLYTKIANVMVDLGYKPKNSASVRDRSFNDQRYPVSTESLNSLGWHERIEFDLGLKETAQWYLDNDCYWSEEEAVLKAHPTFNNISSIHSPIMSMFK